MRRLTIGLIALAPTLPAQNYDDFTLVRNRPRGFSSVLQLQLGMHGSFTTDNEVSAIGLEDTTALDGHVYYHNARFSSREAQLDAYAGRDGAFLGLRERKPDGSTSVMELTARYVPFYRDGFYRNGDFIPAGRYEGGDYGAYFGFGSAAGEGMTVEFGPYFRRLSFDENDTTPAGFVLPDDFIAYGVRASAEHNTLQLDRPTGRPLAGFILTLQIEAERNESNGFFGSPSFMSSLPEDLWRSRAHLEWYTPQSGLGTWAIQIDGKWADDRDRVTNSDAQLPIGHRWVEGELGLRFDFGSIAVQPFGTVQWVNALQESGVRNSEDVFFGGGVEMTWDLGDSMSLFADYSYLENRSRAPVSGIEDVLGEHQFYAGVTVRIGGQRL
ncbi:MAG: hypothetical protein KDB80_17525 [Planctomycetes bacterium]|nr:hypothetical protein [Planctomycetota bacterium]